jgi:hypothetical protein
MSIFQAEMTLETFMHGINPDFPGVINAVLEVIHGAPHQLAGDGEKSGEPPAQESSKKPVRSWSCGTFEGGGYPTPASQESQDKDEDEKDPDPESGEDANYTLPRRKDPKLNSEAGVLCAK